MGYEDESVGLELHWDDFSIGECLVVPFEHLTASETSRCAIAIYMDTFDRWYTWTDCVADFPNHSTRPVMQTGTFEYESMRPHVRVQLFRFIQLGDGL